MCGLEKWFRGQSAYLVRKKPWAWHHRKSGMGRYTPVISVLGMWKQGDQELKASLGYTRVGLKRTKPEGLRKVTPPYLIRIHLCDCSAVSCSRGCGFVCGVNMK